MTENKPDAQEMHAPKVKQSAQYYVNLGMPIIPVCPPNHRRMPNSHREKCKSPGKTPVIPDWTSRGAATAAEIEQWFTRNPFINIGLVLGRHPVPGWNLVGVDVDGSEGERLLQEWSEGDLPPTWEFVTGQGRRLLYKLPNGMASKKTKEAVNKMVAGPHQELALLANGQQTVLPPSIHPSGSLYTWTEGRAPSDLMIADAPEWISSRVLRTMEDGEDPGEAELSPPVEGVDWSRVVGQGERNTHLTKLAGSLVARRNIPTPEIILFLKTWNKNYCDPPLPDDEIEAMVHSISASEQMKHAKRQSQKKKDKEVMRPIEFAKLFLQKQKDTGFSWKYIDKRGCFYYCDNLIGPWKTVPIVMLQKSVRDLLVEQNDGWDKMSNINEAISALKELLMDPENEDLFDIGRRPQMTTLFLANGVLNMGGILDARERARKLGVAPEQALVDPQVNANSDNFLRRWTPECYSTLRLPVEFIPHQTAEQLCPEWLQALEEWLPDPDTRRFLKQYIGYCLVPDCSYRTAVFLYGEGSNGKSLFLDVVTKLFGFHISHIPLHRLAERFELAGVVDKLINVCADIDAKYLEETNVLKGLIAGDTLRGEHKYGKSFDFAPVARLIFSANTLPRSGDRSMGWYSRWKFVHFSRTFAVNPAFKRSFLSLMATDRAMSGVLAWAIEGLAELLEQNRFGESVEMKSSAKEYKGYNDNVVAFASQCLVSMEQETSETTLVLSSLHKVYKQWCEYQGYRPVSHVEFSRRIIQAGFKKGVRTINKKSTNCLVGVRFATSDDLDRQALSMVHDDLEREIKTAAISGGTSEEKRLRLLLSAVAEMLANIDEPNIEQISKQVSSMLTATLRRDLNDRLDAKMDTLEAVDVVDFSYTQEYNFTEQMRKQGAGNY